VASKTEILALLHQVQARLHVQLTHIAGVIHGDKTLKTNLLYRQTEAVRSAFAEIEQFLNTNL
jgi:hypothetical protein